MSNFDEETISIRIQKEDWELLREQQELTGLSMNDLVNLYLSKANDKPVSDKTKLACKRKGLGYNANV